VGYERKWPWQAVVVIGYGFVGIEVIAIPAILIAVSIILHYGENPFLISLSTLWIAISTSLDRLWCVPPL